MDILAASCGAYRHSRSALSGFERQPVLAHVAAPMVRARSYLPLFRSTLKPIPNPGLECSLTGLSQALLNRPNVADFPTSPPKTYNESWPGMLTDRVIPGIVKQGQCGRLPDQPPPKTNTESWPGMLTDRVIPGIVEQAQCGRLPDQPPTLKPIPNPGLECSLIGLSQALLNRPNVADFPTSPPP